MPKDWLQIKKVPSMLGFNNLSSSQNSLKYYVVHDHSLIITGLPEEPLSRRHTGKAQMFLLLFWFVCVCLLFCLQSPSGEANLGTQDLNSKEGTETENTSLFVRRTVAYWLAQGVHAQLLQDHLPEDGSTATKLGPLTSVTNQENALSIIRLAYRSGQQRYFLNCDSLFPDESRFLSS